ncbi:uncharacterized protein HMPREF1541_02997 [Cyphellophora europaea CBS 101466]|uniref:Beta-lactamase-related domain-containing protein n=1 Tax=Cyphellophora europaea (strain CBS 101466) TaxID=1220924 RepID=W2RX88_CYPE1|nr:uncharacterized protein HMPREF1541_02997 [Cyphellophora europaea CBS 101466]ETN41062.1 hypothetical protein HMPREF1541_02997 [Cyphellophora europaea CBS 101466]
MANSLKDFEEYLTSLAPATSTSPSIPGVVLLAASRDPAIPQYSFSCGTTSVSPSRSPAPALTPASSFWFASATKLLTSLAALQLVERGLWTLHRPVAEAVPELGALQHLTGWSEDGLPTYGEDVNGKRAGARVTLRHLLTHTSGMGYHFLNPKLIRWWKWRAEQEGRDVQGSFGGTVTGGLGGPLVNEPGTVWEYGPGIDWAGLLVERIYGEEEGKLGRVIQREVLGPVNVKEREAVWRKADLKWSEQDAEERWVDMTARGPEGLVPAGPMPPENATHDLGGSGIRCPAQDWIKVLESLIRNDGRILKPETVERYLYQPQLVDGEGLLGSKLSQSQRTVFAAGPGGRMLSGGLPLPSKDGEAEDEYEYNHSLAGALSRKKGGEGWALHWGGAPNIEWFLDPNAGVGGVFATQLLPPVDKLMLDLAVDFREKVIEALGTKS